MAERICRFHFHPTDAEWFHLKNSYISPCATIYKEFWLSTVENGIANFVVEFVLRYYCGLVKSNLTFWLCLEDCFINKQSLKRHSTRNLILSWGMVVNCNDVMLCWMWWCRQGNCWHWHCFKTEIFIKWFFFFQIL